MPPLDQDISSSIERQVLHGLLYAGDLRPSSSIPFSDHLSILVGVARNLSLFELLSLKHPTEMHIVV